MDKPGIKPGSNFQKHKKAGSKFLPPIYRLY